jgi:hypothetical protein
MDQKMVIRENEKMEMKELIEKYKSNTEKLNKANRVIKQIRLEQEDIKDKLKDFMKKHSLQNIFTQDGGKIIYQNQNVQCPVNKKFIEKKILEIMGDMNGRELINKIFNSRETVKREHLIFKNGKEKSQLYV